MVKKENNPEIKTIIKLTACSDNAERHAKSLGEQSVFNLSILDFKVACNGLNSASLGIELHTADETKQKDRLAKSDATWGTLSSGRVNKRLVGPAGM